MQRLLLALLPLLCALARGSDAPAKPWPLWDGQESIVQYAQRVNLPPTKTLDLGNGVTLELVLIPAGEFIMGTPEPEPVDEAEFHAQIALGQMFLAASAAILLVLLGVVVVRAIRRRRRPQYSLARFLAMIVAAGAGVLSGAHWFQSEWMLQKARADQTVAAIRSVDSTECEKPAHKVTITTPFYIGKYEVMQEQYQQVMGANPSRFKGKSNPVECVSWNDSQEFCKKLSQSTGQLLRLPTEAEWERACRAGTQTAYYTGDTEADLDRAGCYSSNSPKWTPQPVGGKRPNVWGVYDMHGNVQEWCQDWFNEVYKPEPTVDPQGPSEGQYRSLRGGYWDSKPRHTRSAYRSRTLPDTRVYCFGFGFRVVVSVAPRTP